MTQQRFNSKIGYSIQEPPVTVIDNVGNYNGGTGTFSGTVTAPNFVGMVDGLDLDRYKENLQTGVLYGGIISVNASDPSKIDITAGAGIICTTGASLVAMPVPVVTTVTWTAKIGVTITGIASSDETWFSISSTGTVIQHSVSWTDAQFDSEIPIGAVYHVNHSTVNLVKNYPHVAYGQAGQMDPFIRAFGPLKLSGHEISANGANLSVNRSSGRSYAIGRNYQTDPNNPNIVTDTNALPATVVWRFYRNGGTGFTTVVNSTIDPSHYDDGTGTLHSNTSQWTIQRIFYLPNQPNTIGVYYGRATYSQLADAQLALLTESFTESESTATQGVFLGYLIVKGSVTALNDIAKAKFIQGGLFRNVSGVGGGGLAVAYIDDLSDVTITSAANNDLLKWNGSQWVNSTIASLAISSLGTVTTGTWNATAIADAYISSAATWNTASTDRLKWDGGATGLVAATGRTSLGLIIGTDVQPYSATLAAAAGGTYTGNVTGNVSGSSGSCTGNAATATNVAYTGLTGTVPTWNQSTTGNAATVTDGAYINVDNNFTVYQIFQSDIDVYGDAYIGTSLSVGTTINGLTVSYVNGTGNTVVGNAAGTTLGNGANHNVLVGLNAGDAISNGDRNIGIGKDALGLLSTTADNIAIGYQAGDALTTGSKNVAIGSDALSAATTAVDCIAIGYNALLLNTADNSLAIGSRALDALTTGTSNVAIGTGAASAINTGSNNFALGTDALKIATTCNNSVALGTQSLQSLTTGLNNIGIGTSALQNHQTTHNNLAIGTYSMFKSTTATACVAVGNSSLGGSAVANTTCTGSVAVGASALAYLETGWYNNAIGYNALNVVTSGQYNIGIGNGAGDAVTTGSSNVAIGSDALGAAQTTTGCVAVGHNALLLNTAVDTTAIGYLALDANTTGVRNTAVGAYSLSANQTAVDNTAVGYNTLKLNTGDTNVAVGSNALAACTTGSNNVAFGTNALNALGIGSYNMAVGGSLRAVTSGVNNVAVGQSAAVNVTTGVNNIAIGTYALYQANTTSSENIAIGNQAGGAGAASPTIQSQNVFIGTSCARLITTGSSNVGIGQESLYNITTSGNNTAIGSQAGRYIADGATAMTATANAVYVGYGVRGSANSVTNETALGYVAIGLGSNTTAIGNSSTLGNRIFGVASTGQVAPTIASAATIAPTKTITFISGTAAIATITAPSLIATTGGQITLIPTGIFTTTAAGNIALASTAVVSKALIMTYDATTAKWYPSY